MEKLDKAKKSVENASGVKQILKRYMIILIFLNKTND